MESKVDKDTHLSDLSIPYPENYNILKILLNSSVA